MPRRIACYMIFVTLVWSAFGQNEEKIRNTFKSNITRNEFSNLLQSLIKLNEQRVNVLQKLYKLDDYSIISEVLRSGSKGRTKGNPNNLVLVVVSKNQTIPTRRNTNIQVVDTVSSLDVKLGNINLKPELRSKRLKHQTKVKPILKTAAVSSKEHNTSQDNLEQLFGTKMYPKTPKHKIKGRFQIDNGKHKRKTTPRNIIVVDNLMTKLPKDSSTEAVVYNPDASTDKAEEDLNKTKTTVKIKDSSEIEAENQKYPKIVKDRYQIDNLKNKRKETDEANTEENDPIDKYHNEAKEMYGAEEHNNKYLTLPKDMYDKDDQSNKYPKISRDKFNGGDHNSNYPNIPKEMYGGNDNSNKYSNIPKDLYDRNENSNKYSNIPKNSNKNDHSNKYPNIPKDMYDRDDHRNKYPNIPKYMFDRNGDISKYPKIGRDKSEGNNHNKKSNIKPPQEDGISDDDDHSIKYSKLSQSTYDDDIFDNDARTSIEVYNTKSGKDNSEYPRKGNQHLDSANVESVEPESSLESRKNLQKCISKKALKLCCKSCINAYKTVCRRLKCTSRAKKSLKKECKRSCRKVFSSSKYSSED